MRGGVNVSNNNAGAAAGGGALYGLGTIPFNSTTTACSGSRLGWGQRW
jgi:hypothetical protein